MHFIKESLIVFGMLHALSLAACVAESTTPVASSESSATPRAAETDRSDEPEWAVTLPVLYVFLSDESFVGDAQAGLGLTDKDINQLKTVGREATDRLRAAEIEGRERALSAAELRAEAHAKVNNVIGEGKTRQLFTLVAERWGGHGEAAEAGLTQPNAVPTDSRVVVNIPAFRMDVFEDGDLIKSYIVGIGYPEFPLPTGVRYAETIIFNPPWTPPDSPWVKSTGKVKAGETVKPGDKRNPLGALKIPIGLPSLIHGGKSPKQLGSFASHGCVGLTDSQAVDFAKLLARLGDAQLTDEQIAEYEKERTESRTVKLNKPIPVELRYETIMVEDGKLHIYRDVYDRDTNTEQELREVLAVYDSTPEELSEEERSSVLRGMSEMSRDASGRPDSVARRAADSGGNGNAPERSPGKRPAERQTTSNVKVTRAVRGEKQVAIQVAVLRDKGYPAPVGLDSKNVKNRSVERTG